ncbi:hypothetical protein RDABS01_026344, partial [Bienertia sinuspersici]
MVGKRENSVVQLWDMVVYEAAFDGEDIAVVLSSAIIAAQEVITCPLPPELKANLWNDCEVQVTFDMTTNSNNKNNEKGRNNKYKYNLCACTMVWNQAVFIREWVMCHGWLGVQRWFVYDNNSDDGLNEVINELNGKNYNVSRHASLWVKSQEAGFSHCVLRAKDQCKWIALFDVDEFYYFAPPKARQNTTVIYQGPNSLQDVVKRISSRPVGEIRTACHNFQPSGTKKSPLEGLMLGYTCRLKSAERHKLIIRPDDVDDSLLNQVHHFELKKEFKKINFRAVILNHYKYQVWDFFKAKFYRRQENQNEKSRDKIPRLGTEAIELPNWHLKFCDVY